MAQSKTRQTKVHVSSTYSDTETTGAGMILSPGNAVSLQNELNNLRTMLRVFSGSSAWNIAPADNANVFQTSSALSRKLFTFRNDVLTDIWVPGGQNFTVLQSSDRNDAYDGTTLNPKWLTLNPPTNSTFLLNGGFLRITPGTTATGFANAPNRTPGPYVYQSFTGDFDVRVTLWLRNAADSGDAPGNAFRSGALVASDGLGATNWFEAAMWTATSAAFIRRVAIHSDNTGAHTTLSTTGTGVTSAQADLRITRVGQLFTLYWRATNPLVPLEDNTGWTTTGTVDRSATPISSSMFVGTMLRTSGAAFADCLLRVERFIYLGTDDASELPISPASIGLVSTEGSVVAFHGGTFGTFDLAEVTGPTAVRPLNLCLVTDPTTGDPLTSGTSEVYALLQSESSVNGSTFNDTTQRAQLSYVRINATGDDLEAVPSADIEARYIRYSYVRRLQYQNLPEYAFLAGNFADGGGGSVDVTLTNALANQSGPAPQDQDIQVRIDDSFSWSFRDSTGASSLLSISPTLAGDTVAVGGDDFLVDVTDVFEAVSNSFLIEGAADSIIRTSGGNTLTVEGGDGGSIDVMAGGWINVQTTGTDNVLTLQSSKVHLQPTNETAGSFYLKHNANYSGTATTSGLVTLVSGTATTTIQGLTAGVAGVSNPVIAVGNGALFATGDYIMLEDALDPRNNGLYEVLSVASNNVTIRGVGLSNTLQAFTDRQLVTDASVFGNAHRVTVSVMRAGTDGRWETAQGASNSIIFDNLALEGSTLPVFVVTSPVFGAIGNGIANDTAAIQAAVSAATAAGGGIVYFPPGTYSIASTITRGSNVTLMGAGMFASIIQGDLSTPLIGVPSPGYTGSPAYSAAHVFNLTIDGVDRDLVGKVGLDLSRCYNTEVRNVRVIGCNVGFLLSNASFWNNMYDFQVSTCRTGVRLYNGVNSCQFWGGNVETVDVAYLVEDGPNLGCNNDGFFGCHASTFNTGSGYGYHLNSPVANRVDSITIVGPRLETGTVGLQLSGTPRRVILDQPYFSGVTTSVAPNPPPTSVIVRWDGQDKTGVRVPTVNDYSVSTHSLLTYESGRVAVRDSANSAYAGVRLLDVLSSGGQSVSWGAGTPEGSITASVGSLRLRTDGASGTTLYIKESGAGNTGWTAISTATGTTYSKTVGALTADVPANTNITGSGGTPNIDAILGDYSAVTFTSRVKVYVNGMLMRNGSSSTSNFDVYPGVSPATGDLRFEFDLALGDVITMEIFT